MGMRILNKLFTKPTRPSYLEALAADARQRRNRQSTSSR